MAQVLLVGDDKHRTSEVKSLLALDGHTIHLTRDVTRWRDDERASSPEVVVAAVATTDAVLSVPMGGPRGFAPPLLFVHAESDETRDTHVPERMIDRIVSPFAAEEFLARVDALVRVRRVVMRHKPASPAFELSAPSRRPWSDILTLFKARIPRHAKPPAPYLEVAAAVADWSDRRDTFEPGHAERVTNFSAMIADEFGLGDGETAALLRAAMLHDVGKVALPIEVLRQMTPLDEDQKRLVRTHAERGAAILRALDKDELVADAIHYHHENVDGSGYFGRKGDDIPRAAKILAVAEGFDAMTTSLVRKKLTTHNALGLLREYRGGQWDAECVDALVSAMRPSPVSLSLSLV